MRYVKDHRYLNLWNTIVPSVWKGLEFQLLFPLRDKFLAKSVASVHSYKFWFSSPPFCFGSNFNCFFTTSFTLLSISLLLYNGTSTNWIKGIISNKNSVNCHQLTWIKSYTLDFIPAITGGVCSCRLKLKKVKYWSTCVAQVSR